MGMNMADEEVKKPLRIDYYVKLVLKKRWMILIPLCLSLAVGFLYTISQPRFYQARTLILVVPKSVPDKYVPNLVSSDVADRINTISQQIKSRTSLEKIMEEYRLFEGPQYKNMYKEDKLRAIRSNIGVHVSRGRQGVESFTITYKGKIPVKVMRVVNSLADRFITESIKVMESEVIETRDFIEGELTVMKRRLENVERKMKEYREKYMGELPEQLPSNLKILERLQEQLSERREMMRDARNRLTSLENRIRLANIKSEAGVPIEEEKGKLLTPYERMLKERDEIEENLATLSSRYTEQHPDVIRQKQRLSEIESKIRLAKQEFSQKQASVEAAAFEKESEEDVPATPEDAALFELKSQRKELVKEIGIYEEDIANINKQIELYEERVENTPKREQDLMSLRRGYGDIQRAYSEMLARKLEAQIAVNMERKQKGQKFRIVDRATLPQKPVSPDPKMLFILFVGAGFAVGGGIIFLLEFIDSSLKIPEDIETDLELPVLATIPRIYTRKEKRMRILDRFLSLGVSAVAFVMFCCFALMALKGVNRTLNLFEKVYKHFS